MRSLARAVYGIGLVAIVTAACSADKSGSTFGGGGEASGSAQSAGGSTSAGLALDGGTASGSPSGPCNAGLNDDKDNDGFTRTQGDCDDCDPNVNPNALEVIAEPDADGGVPPASDEDCDGKIDNVA